MTHLTRRSAVKVAAAAVAAPWIVPSRVLGARAPSSTLRIGCIGTGRRGRQVMRDFVHNGLSEATPARIAAVCDVDGQRVADAVRGIATWHEERGSEPPGDIGTHADFRELLARDDLDAVLITTPEHWHALQAAAAARAGKHVYVEKPMTYSLEEGRRLVEVVREAGVVLQVGSQQRSDRNFHRACEAVRNGRLGRLRTIRVQLPRDQGVGLDRPADPPAKLDYDMWMGPTALRPYTEHRVHPESGYGRPGWLQIERYCLGMITGWGSHMNDIAQWGHGGDADSGPVEIEARGSFPSRGLFDVHTDYRAEARYADGVALVQQTGNPAGVRFEGDDGWIWVQRGRLESSTPEVLEPVTESGAVRLYRSTNHTANFLQCAREGTEPVCPVEVGHRSQSVCMLTHIAMKLARPLRWDPGAERFVDDDEANAMLDHPHRAPWEMS
ncbi:MAG: Gfo/Idh/MocA family protein [Planctomycetota bacterium]|jgi:predicted dehydrogenase